MKLQLFISYSLLNVKTLMTSNQVITALKFGDILNMNNSSDPTTFFPEWNIPDFVKNL